MSDDEKMKAIHQITSDDASYTTTPNESYIQKPDLFLPPELIVNCQLGRTLQKIQSVSAKQFREVIMTDTDDEGRKSIAFILDEHRIEKQVLQKDGTQKATQSSNRIDGFREQILRGYRKQAGANNGREG